MSTGSDSTPKVLRPVRLRRRPKPDGLLAGSAACIQAHARHLALRPNRKDPNLNQHTGMLRKKRSSTAPDPQQASFARRVFKGTLGATALLLVAGISAHAQTHALVAEGDA